MLIAAAVTPPFAMLMVGAVVISSLNVAVIITVSASFTVRSAWSSVNTTVGAVVS
jgi:hypothetical protein